MPADYIVKQADGYRIAGSRISLDSVVYGFLAGQTPESIAQSFPLLSLEQVYGAITFYLAHRREVDAHLAQNRADYDALRERARGSDPMFYRKLADARLHQA